MLQTVFPFTILHEGSFGFSLSNILPTVPVISSSARNCQCMTFVHHVTLHYNNTCIFRLQNVSSGNKITQNVEKVTVIQAADGATGKWETMT